MKVFHRGLILVGIPFILELLLITSLFVLINQSTQEQVIESKYRKITGIGGRILGLITEAPYFIVLSIQFQKEEFFKLFEKDREEIRQLVKQADDMRRQTPDLFDGSLGLQESQARLIDITDQLAEAKKKGNLLDLISTFPRVRAEFDRAKTVAVHQLNALVERGEMRTKQIEANQARIRDLQTAILLTGIIGNIAAGSLLFWYFRKSIMMRLGVIKDNTEKLSKGQQLSDQLTGSDEIAALDKAFHEMNNELMAAAAREKDLFDNASDVICVLDFDYKFIKVNLASARVWGYEPRLLMMMGLGNVVLPEDLRATLEAIDGAKVSGKPVEFESRMVTRSEQVLETLWSAYWSETDNALFCVVHDITERKNAERVKKHFLAMISFDLKRPLSSISAAVTMLVGNLADAMPKMAVDKLDMAKKNLKRLLGLVNDLLQLTEMDSGNFEIKKEICDVEELLIRAVQDVEAVAEKGGVKLEIKCCEGKWFVDPNRIMQVLVNLLSNAIKFSPKDGLVTLSAAKDGDLYVVKVIDQGRGVPEAHKAAIFEKFKQVEAADGKRKAGTGLGLPICKQIVEEHCGTIGVDSVDGKGSTFWFRVPVDETVSMRIKAQALAAERQKLQEKAEREHQPVEPLRKLQEAPQHKGLAGKLKLAQQGAVLIGIPVLFEFAFVGSMSAVIAQIDHERNQELYQRNLAFNASKLINTYFRAVIVLIEGRTEADWITFQQCIAVTRRTIAGMNDLARGDDKERLARIIQQEGKIEPFFLRAEAIMSEGYSPMRIKDAFSGKDRLTPALIGLCHKLQKLCTEIEKRESVSPEKQNELKQSLIIILIGGLVANIGICVAMALFFSRNITSRLQVLADNADKLAKEKELNPLLSGMDEIAELDRVFHATALAVSEARQKERAVFDNSQDVIFAIDPKGVFQSVNPAAEKLWGYSKEQLIGTSLFEIIVPEDRDAAREMLFSDSGGRRRCEFEARLKKNDETIEWVLWSCSKGSDFGNIVCIAHDITNRKELEQLKQEFLAMVSHDLRTPLTSILGIAKLIIAGAFGKVTERPMEVLKGITRNGDQLLELINDLLDIEKLEAGKMQLMLEHVKIKEIIEKSVASTHDAKRVAISAQTTDGLEIMADRDRIIQAIANILNHALDHSPDETAVEISFNHLPEFTEITVKDAAAPIPEPAREALFDRFKQIASGAPPSEQDTAGGSGLAMPIARKIVESHGGTIGVMPRGETGNVFRIRLPATRDASAPTQVLASN